MTAGAVRLVLDTSAVLAYAAGAVNLGETIAEVVDEGNRFTVPVLCLVEAARQADGQTAEGVRLLTGHVAGGIAPMRGGDWQAITAAAAVVGRADAACAVVEAVACDGYVVTAAPELYGDLDDGTIIPI